VERRAFGEVRWIVVCAVVLACIAGLGVATPAQSAPASGENFIGRALADPDSTYIPAAELAVTGCGNTCDYKDPFRYKIYHGGCSTCYHYCADDRNFIDSYENPIAYVELWYSPRCRTAWAATTFVGFEIKVKSYYTDGRLRAVASSITNENFRYSPMLNDAGLLAHGCIYVPFSALYCTKKY